MPNRRTVGVILGIIVLLALMAIPIWWTWAQYNSCMAKFSDWFYCVKHAL